MFDYLRGVLSVLVVGFLRRARRRFAGGRIHRKFCVGFGRMFCLNEKGDIGGSYDIFHMNLIGFLNILSMRLNCDGFQNFNNILNLMFGIL